MQEALIIFKNTDCFHVHVSRSAMKMLFNLTAPEGELEASWVGLGDGETDIRWRRLDQTNPLPAWQSDWHEGRAREYWTVSVVFSNTEF